MLRQPVQAAVLFLFLIEKVYKFYFWQHYLFS